MRHRIQARYQHNEEPIESDCTHGVHPIRPATACRRVSPNVTAATVSARLGIAGGWPAAGRVDARRGMRWPAALRRAAGLELDHGAPRRASRNRTNVLSVARVRLPERGADCYVSSLPDGGSRTNESSIAHRTHSA